MGLALISFIQNHWPFKQRKLDDLELSDRLVNRLSIPEHTKKFVFAIVEPESGAVVYILAAQNLSRQSALDAECLIKEVRPDVVVTQVAPSCTEEIRNNKSNDLNAVPTSLFGVLKGCFVDKIDKDKYESLAGSVLLKAIFGVGFYGHFFAAKKAAEEVGSEVFYVESPFVSSCADEVNNHSVESNEVEKNVRALSSSASSLVPQNAGSGVSSKRLFSTGNQHSETLKSLVSALSQLNQEAGVSNSVSRAGLGDCHPVHDYRAPSFAQTVYPLLIDLHSVFGNLPSIDTALAHAQKMFYSVSNGERVDKQLLSEVQNFQIAVEGLRIGLNSAGRCPINKAEKSTSCKPAFSELPTEDKSHVLFAQAIRSQTQNFKSVVAIVDASSLAGLRKHWNTFLPAEVKDMIKESLTKYESDEEISSAKNPDKKRLIPDKPVVAVGAGTTAVLGASSLSKVVPASTFVKLVTLKIPASLKIALAQTHKAVAISFGKAFGTSQVTSPGLITSGAKSASVMKAAASTKNISAVTHSIRAYAQRTSFSAMRTAFYEIMRKRYVQPIGYMPWIKFGCSVSACSGLLMYGDGIECAVESMPVAPAIASLGRGLQNLHKANQVVKRADSTKVQEAIQSLMYRFKR